MFAIALLAAAAYVPRPSEPEQLDASPRSGDELLVQPLGALPPVRMPRARVLASVDAYETPHYGGARRACVPCGALIWHTEEKLCCSTGTRIIAAAWNAPVSPGHAALMCHHDAARYSKAITHRAGHV